MARADVEALRMRFSRIREELLRYRGLHVYELPDDLRKQLLALPIIPALTSGGLESVETAIRMIAFAEAIMNDVLAHRGGERT